MGHSSDVVIGYGCVMILEEIYKAIIKHRPNFMEENIRDSCYNIEKFISKLGLVLRYDNQQFDIGDYAFIGVGSIEMDAKYGCNDYYDLSNVFSEENKKKIEMFMKMTFPEESYEIKQFCFNSQGC